MSSLTWLDAIDQQKSDRARAALTELRDGHMRFRHQGIKGRNYESQHLTHLVQNPQPIAAIVACSDSRVAPEIIFDQPLGQLFVSRVPGNVASDGTKWMLEIAVAELKVPIVLVLGHTHCLAVGQMVEGKVGGAGGTLRFDVQKAVHRAKMSQPSDLYRTSVRENVLLTIENLHRDSFSTQRAIEKGELGLVGGIYDMDSGDVELIGA